MASTTVHRSRYSTRQEAKRARNLKRRERRGFDPLTDEQKAAKRAEHRERLDRALAEVAELEGFARFLEARTLNPQLSAGNVALVASQLPGQVVGSFAHWKGEGSPVRKGQSASAWITGRAFWPRAVWGHGEVDHPLERIIGTDEPPMPNRAEVERLHADFLAAVADGTPTLEALEAVPEVQVDADDPFRFPEPVSDTHIPF
jgi:hypothetical protein